MYSSQLVIKHLSIPETRPFTDPSPSKQRFTQRHSISPKSFLSINRNRIESFFVMLYSLQLLISAMLLPIASSVPVNLCSLFCGASTPAVLESIETAGIQGIRMSEIQSSKPAAALSRSTPYRSAQSLHDQEAGSRSTSTAGVIAISSGSVDTLISAQAAMNPLEWTEQSIHLFHRISFPIRYTSGPAKEMAGRVVDESGIVFGVKSVQLDTLFARKLQVVVEERIGHLEEMGLERGNDHKAMIGIMGDAVYRDIKQVFAEIQGKWGVGVQGDNEVRMIAAETLAEIKRQWMMPIKSG